MIHIADAWKDYQVIATGDGYKLERWKDVCLLRPDPQVIWKAQRDLFSYPGMPWKLPGQFFYRSLPFL